jgi:NAD(P)H-nitrite reductase large subunit
MTERPVIIGNGIAPGRMLEHLFEMTPGRYSVTIFKRRAPGQLRSRQTVARHSLTKGL